VSSFALRTAADNPFSTRCVRPGTVPFLFPDDEDVQRLVGRLREQGWWGAVLGPHGSGKSALLATLVEAIKGLSEKGSDPLSQGGLTPFRIGPNRLPRRVLRVALHDRQRRLPDHARRALAQDTPEQLVIDGYEQLGRLARWRLRRNCRRRGLGLLVSAHRPVGLPELYRTRVDLSLARRLVEQLQAGHEPLVGHADVAAAYARHGENLRELLFALYDLYESRR